MATSEKQAELPQEGYVRIWQITGCKKRGIAPVIPLGRSTFLQNLKNGKYPFIKKIQLSERTTAYRVEDVRRLIAELGGESK